MYYPGGIMLVLIFIEDIVVFIVRVDDLNIIILKFFRDIRAPVLGIQMICTRRGCSSLTAITILTIRSFRICGALALFRFFLFGRSCFFRLRSRVGLLTLLFLRRFFCL